MMLVNKIKMILFSTIFLLVFVFCSAVFADPSIVLYINGGSDYYTGPDTWFNESFVTSASKFTLVIDTWGKDFYDLHLVAAVPKDDIGTLDVTYYLLPFDDPRCRPGQPEGSLLMSGTPIPPYDNSKFTWPPHGVFPTDYVLFKIGNITNDVNEPILLNIEWSGYSMIHFDAFAYDGKKWDVNPFSHDVTAGSPPPPVPEPASMLMFGTGLIGLVGIWKKKFFS